MDKVYEILECLPELAIIGVLVYGLIVIIQG